MAKNRINFHLQAEIYAKSLKGDRVLFDSPYISKWPSVITNAGGYSSGVGMAVSSL